MNRLTSAFLLVSVLSAGCANQTTTPPPEPPSSAPLQPLPPPSPAALALAAASSAAKQLGSVPCPPPNLPPELAPYLDCAAMQGFSDALAYAPRQMASGTLPSHIDLRAHGLSGPTKDQGAVGACAGFAMSTTMDNAARRFGRQDVMAPLHVFSLYSLEQNDGFSRALRSRPITVERVWPWDGARACRMADSHLAVNCGAEYGVVPGTAKHDPRLMAEKERADRQGRLQIAGYEDMATDPVDLDQIALVVASGEAIWASVAFARSAWQSLLRSGACRMPFYPESGDRIGHAVTIEGYRAGPTGREFLLHNSWGRDWGSGGYAWMHESQVLAHLRNAYRVLVVDASVPLQQPEQHCTTGRVPILDVCMPGLPGLPNPGATPWARLLPVSPISD